MILFRPWIVSCTVKSMKFNPKPIGSRMFGMPLFRKTPYPSSDSPQGGSGHRTIRSVRFVQLVWVLTMLSVFCVCQAWSQDYVDELQTIRKAVAEGDARQLMAVSTESIELALFAASQQYTRSQATLVLKQFFKQNTPTSFELVDSTRSNRSLFVEGRMRTSNYEVPLRTYFRLKKSADGWKLREFLIESPDR